MDVLRFNSAPLKAFSATMETNYENETNGRIPWTCHAFVQL